MWQDELRDVREYKSLSQREVSTRAGLSPDAYALIEGGKREPKVTTLKAIAEALGYGSLASLCKRIGL